MPVLSVKVDRGLLRRIDHMASTERVSRSDLVRSMILDAMAPANNTASFTLRQRLKRIRDANDQLAAARENIPEVAA